MILLILGLALWVGAHMFKRISPDRRGAMGEAGRGPIALVILVGVVLMIVGYRMADGAVLWGRTPATVGINNLLMLFSVYLFAAAGLKTAITRKIRHPMLTGVKVWSVAHLLVNGDVESIVLFGGLLAWAVAEVVMINRAEPDWTVPEPASSVNEIKAAVGTVLVFGVAAGIHALLGYSVFG